VKIAPTNQTFIPASNPGKQRFGMQLRSVTIVSARSSQLVTGTAETSEADDNVVVVQAQFAPDLDSETTVTPSLPKLISPPTSGSGRGSSYLSPLEQYARTQSGEVTSQPLVDVRA
jgi:hypothetical protein